MNVLVCGGREFSDEGLMNRALDEIHALFDITRIVHGGAWGADALGGKWAVEHDVKLCVYPANWSEHGRGAGHIRNRRMITEETIDLVVAMPGGKGTANMISTAINAGIPVRTYTTGELL